MCGICGYSGFSEGESMLSRMQDVIYHRGPDDGGKYINGRLGVGMRRLSIIDLEGGSQPIHSRDGKLAIVFNGEIYNYRELTGFLEHRGHQFSTRSDTEVIIHLYEEYGTECVQRLRGMFAFAILDGRDNRLFLARDRLGIKPLYYWNENGRFLFGSEIKAILECPDVKREPNLRSLGDYLSQRYIPGPETLFKGIFKLPAAHWMMLDKGNVRLQRYWTPQASDVGALSDTDYLEGFSELLDESVQQRMISDVPFGVYLSAGVDSTAIAATMSRHSDHPLKTFSVGFDWPGDELPGARETASYLGCDHHEILCGSKDFQFLPQIVWHLDEPVGDAIVMPMYLLSALASKHVKVIQMGEGADEILAGYFTQRVLMRGLQYTRWIPNLLQDHVVRPMVGMIPPGLLNLAFDYPASLGNVGRQRLLDYLELVRNGSLDAQYRFLVSLFTERDSQALFSDNYHADVMAQSQTDQRQQGGTDLDRILFLHFAHWLPDLILGKQDKLTMANSVEGRVPFLDHKLVEFVMAMPPHLKLKGRRNKVALREYLRGIMPKQISNRPKKAFYIPIDKYLREGPLAEIVNICLSEESVKRRGYFNWAYIQHLRRSVDESEFLYGKQVFSLTMLELWHRIFIDGESGWSSKPE